ncbi:MAG: UDP-N-acetylmuramoyl-L-alanyl-D-glutamate--2,6-diaminopimelate ligase [Propionibacteriaceae bacterium]|jgi:UDP-N-acetylmuramoyl-L-alanyl-D-glutamate--2,6-diaminopimelate ligase|nr:UDP-N-acetylmuramoyl-L-alanyl-D-glutamate--2,6-diaminopimelate ligase [Propionibacteriaceae bacterium]
MLTPSGIAFDSRQVKPGYTYIALPGTKTHGARFAAQAQANGAAEIVTDAQGAALADVQIPVRVVDDPRAEMARMAADLFGRPAESLRMFGVTGTAGKTSTVTLLAAGLEAAGVRAATMGTLGTRMGGETLDLGTTTITTPESPDVQRSLAALLERGAQAVGMEVSSHALVLERVAEINFDVAGFTNLGRDHLDYHHTVEEYYQAKKRLFEPGQFKRAVINISDPFGQRLAKEAGVEVLTLSFDGDADYRLLSAEPRAGHTLVRMATPVDEREFVLGMPGKFSVCNAVLAAAMIDAARIDLVKALPGFANVQVPGRMQRVDLGVDAPQAVVDFAHSPEAIASALGALPGRRIAVLGAGGERDAGKREPMGKAAAENAEIVVVTDDNPRGEDPQLIRDAVLAGARSVPGTEVVDGGGRREAIAKALKLAEPGDWVAVLGKGHETKQQWAGYELPFEDAEVLRQEWSRHVGA